MNIEINVTKIVKYVCVTGAVIVAKNREEQ